MIEEKEEEAAAIAAAVEAESGEGEGKDGVRAMTVCIKMSTTQQLW